MPLLFSDAFVSLISDAPLIYIDAGARGGLEGPWADVADNRLHVIAFEPDPAGCAEVAARPGPVWQIVPKALWSKTGTIPIHLAQTRSTSSVHPPNAGVLKRYAARHGDPRRTETIFHAPAITLDQCLAELGLEGDFLKIDTQGAEYEILLGAKNALSSSIFGVITESWTTEVHSGQKLTGDILSLMHGLGFTLFDLNIAAAWQRRSTDSRPVAGKAQITGVDLLFLREPSDIIDSTASVSRRVKAAAIAELYGFPDVALDLLGSCPQDNAIRAATHEVLANTGHDTAKLHY